MAIELLWNYFLKIFSFACLLSKLPSAFALPLPKGGNTDNVSQAKRSTEHAKLNHHGQSEKFMLVLNNFDILYTFK